MDSATESLCGAGRTASVLWGAGFSILGVGLCAKSDDEVLLSLLDAKSLTGRNPHSLRRWESVQQPPRATFCNLGDESTGTSRAIRIYERVGAATILTQRLDWETPPPKKLSLEPLKRLLQRQELPIQAVVLKDLAKGFIRADLVAFLASQLPDKPWFISTKLWQPDWFDVVARVKKVRLLLVPEEAARAALGTSIDDDKVIRRSLAAWMVSSNPHWPSKGALALLDNKLLKSPKGPSGRPAKGVASNVVVVPGDRTILALASSGHGCAYSPKDPDSSVPMAISRVLLGALTGRMLEFPTGDLAGIVEGAAAFTYHWRTFEAGRVTQYRDWNPAAEPHDDLNVEAERVLEPFNWREAHEQWRQAFSLNNLGIIEKHNEPRLELWRAATELPGYICIVRRKRETVSTLAQMLRSFARSDRSRQESCLIEAPAGTGKTHLIRRLAEEAKFQVLVFNITHLYRQEDLLDCFDRISTTQADLREAPLLVFFDEMNGSLGGEPPYSSFLSPLEEGLYVRAEKSFHIGPAVWLFAATAFDRTRLKALDFESRLTRGILPLSAPHGDPEDDSAKLERVYLASSLLKKSFPEIEFIAEDVLDLFRRLPGDISTRRLTQLAANFKDVKRRKVLSENIPWNWIAESSDGAMRSLKEDWEASWRPRRQHVPEVRLITEGR